MSSTTPPSLQSLEHNDEFVQRHIGPDDAQISKMLAMLNLDCLDQLIKNTVPDSILISERLDLGEPCTET